MPSDRSFKVYDTSVIVFSRSGTPSKKRGHRLSDAPDWETFNRLLDVMTSIGFEVGRDPQIEQRFPTLGYSHRYGRWADLEFKGETYTTGCKIEFFQNIVFENPNGGAYDFDRRKKMPYLVGKRFELAVSRLRENLTARGFSEIREEKSANPDPLAYFNDQWDSEYERKRGVHRFERDETGWPAPSALNHSQTFDADKLPIRHGDTLLTRDSKGYLRRGRVWGGINGMWLFVYGPGKRDFTHVSHFELFRENSSRAVGRKVHQRATSRLETTVKKLQKDVTEAVSTLQLERAQKLIARLGRMPAKASEAAHG